MGSRGSIGTRSNSFVKWLVSRAKIDDAEKYGGHFLRVGFVTEASADGVIDREVMTEIRPEALDNLMHYLLKYYLYFLIFHEAR